MVKAEGNMEKAGIHGLREVVNLDASRAAPEKNTRQVI